ncbi:hypothetical protein ROHU_021355 [Labeo rohita]|uniref:Uncharacterized protein n=1 Tax=Labeo rohita TaxID=84645 RepID=A0A498MUR6_LABRO|nr:hypothetical protein ROHU_021355 [Labeo rohita]
MFTSAECVPQAQPSAEWIGGGDELKWITLQPENSFNAAGVSVRPETHIRLSLVPRSRSSGVYANAPLTFQSPCGDGKPAADGLGFASAACRLAFVLLSWERAWLSSLRVDSCLREQLGETSVACGARERGERVDKHC